MKQFAVMPDWTNIPWVLLLPLTAGAGLIAFETARWTRKSLTILAIVTFVFCTIGFAQFEQAPTRWSDSILVVVTIIGAVCLLCSFDDESDLNSVGRQAATMLFAVGCLAVACFATTLPTLLASFAAFVVTQSTMMRFSADERRIRSVQNLAVISFLLLAVGFVLLFALTRSTDLVEIQRIFRASYQPTRDDMVVGKVSFLGVVSIVLIIGASALQLAAIPFHTHSQDQIEHQTGWLAVWLSVSSRGFGFLLLWRTVVTSFPGFELDAQLALLIAAVFSALGGACLAVRSQSLRGVLHAGWIVSSGVLLMTMAIAVRQSDQLNSDKWHFPDVFETALIGFAISSAALLLGVACEQVLRLPTRRIDFVEDLAGLSKRRPAVAAMLSVSLLTACAIPPLPGFWNVVFMTVNSYAPQAEATDSPVLIPNMAVLIGNVLVVVALVCLAARMIDILSTMYLDQPLGLPDQKKRPTSFVVATLMASLLVLLGVSPSTLIWMLHAVAQ